jgi:hypothetical protein
MLQISIGICIIIFEKSDHAKVYCHRIKFMHTSINAVADFQIFKNKWKYISITSVVECYLSSKSKRLINNRSNFYITGCTPTPATRQRRVLFLVSSIVTFFYEESTYQHRPWLTGVLHCMAVGYGIWHVVLCSGYRVRTVLDLSLYLMFCLRS